MTRDDDELLPLTPDLEGLLESERRAPSAPAEARERVRSRLALAVGAAAVGAAGSATANGTPPLGTTALKAAPTVGKLLALKVGLGVAAAIGVGIGAHVLLTKSPAPVAAPAVAPTPVTERGERSERKRGNAEPVATPPAPEATSIEPPSLPAPSTPAHKHAGVGDLAGERALLESARSALAEGDPARAQKMLERHAQRFPRGQLAEEREGLAVRALVAAGRPDEARARAQAFERRWPRSIFLPAVEAALSGR